MRTFARGIRTMVRRDLVRWALHFFIFALLLGFSQCSKPADRQISVTRLSNNFEPLKAQFNRDAGKVRLLLLLDPT
jgi:hypothetical protein